MSEVKEHTPVMPKLAPERPEQPVIKSIEMTPVIDPATASAVEIARARHVEEKKREVRHFRLRAFWLVLVPTALAALYLFAYSADQYVSELQFLVRSKGGASTFATQGQTFIRAHDDSQILSAYIESRDLVAKLSKESHLKDIYDRPEADILSRFPSPIAGTSEEDLLRHYRKWVKLTLDEATGISTVKVHAFRAEDAQSLAQAILKASESFINLLNQRGFEDRLRYTKRYVDDAEAEVLAVEKSMRDFRNASSSVDPSREATALFEIIGKMTTEVAQLEANLAQQTQMAPNNPSIPSLRKRISTYREEIEKLRQRVAGSTSSIASNLSRYEGLTLERQLAARKLEGAILSFNKAREEAETQQIYLIVVAEPNRPDLAERFRRGYLLIAVFLASVGLTAVGTTLGRTLTGVRP